jgi:hypothetical protein
MATSKNAPIVFPATEFKVQSPYLYLQTVGSTGADGSAYGAHVRWLLLRNLGDSHLPKGDSAATKVNFNRPGDYLTLFRSPYIQRFPTVVDFTLAPSVVNDSLAFWIYRTAETNTVVYIHFRDTAKYTAVRAATDPAAQPQQFVQQYCPGLIEAELKDKLCFAVEFDVARTAETVMRAEALSVEANVPLSPLFVSCRQRFTNAAWCPPADHASPPERPRTGRRMVPADAPAVCGGPNLLSNGDFELNFATMPFWFETDYVLQGGAGPGSINVTTDAAKVNPPWWQGQPHSGAKFLTVDGSTTPGKAVLRFRLTVDRGTDYSFTGWLSSIDTTTKDHPSVPLQVRFTSAGVAQAFDLATPPVLGIWEPFTISWSSGTSDTVVVEIFSSSIAGGGNDFGLDDLWFCMSKAKEECRARIRSENIRSVRFDVNNGYPRGLELETYDDYIAGALWGTLDRLALTTEDNAAFNRLEPAPDAVNGQWQKFNDHALLTTANYQDRWSRAGGLKQGVQRYIALSNTNPLAIDTLAGAIQPQDGSIQISMLDALRMVSLDFHVARMLGLGSLDLDFGSDSDELIYLGVYDTDGALDDSNVARPVRHYYMGIPTRPLDHRLPDAPLLQAVSYGLTVDNGEPQPSFLTDLQGYTPDGLARYVSLFLEPDADISSLNPFFVPPVEFSATDKTNSTFYGVEYRKQGEAAWRKPEIAHDAVYLDLDTPPQFETLPLPNNHDSSQPFLRHEERENGVHEYGGYGINWFSRVSPVGNVVATDATAIKKAARLLPPTNFAVQLIQPELPLMLTTLAEQDALAHLAGTDKTLVRVMFDYFHVHDINYRFADTVELFFRQDLPRNVVGAVRSAIDDPADGRNAILRTEGYAVNSQGTTLAPALDPALFANFVGGVLSCQQESYIIAAVSASTVAGEGPIFTVQKNVKGNPLDPGSTGAFVTVQEYVKPDLGSANAQVMFMAVENMADANSWGTPNPLSRTIAIGDSSWTTHQETYVQDGDTVTVSLRGVLSPAVATPEPPSAPDQGVYRLDFQTYLLPHHPQSAEANPVEWYKGVVRIARALHPNGPKKILEVLLVEHAGDGQPLVLHAVDNDFDAADPIITGVPATVNYYPGYKVYLHADATHGFTEVTLLPAAGEGNRKTWLGARSRDTAQQVSSPVGIPAPIVALEFVTPLEPAQPRGGDYATRPDFYYKSSYTFRIDFVPGHKPFAAAMYRSNDEAILRTLYKDDTYDAVRQQLDLLGEDDPYGADRWRNLLGFDYVYDVSGAGHPYFDPTHSNTNGTFRKFPPENGYEFPNPDKGGALNGSAPGGMLAALREAIWGAFTALTELPLIYDFIKGPSYMPVPKPQNLRDAQGTLLPPTDPAFDMAPMAKKTGNGFEIQFTDFTLDGTGNNIFFYLGREIGNRGRLGDPGPIAGPVQLINTRPPDAPAVKKMYVQEPMLLANVGPAVNFEVNAYPAVQRVRRMLIYRATGATDTLSVRTMQLVKTIDLDATGQAGKLSLSLSDDFESGFVPYGDPLFYRLVALRKVKKPGGGTDWAPSQPSKVLLTTMIDTINPEAPEITFTSDGLSGSPATLTGVILSWPTTVYNGTYYLDKMSSAGNWLTIYRLKTKQSVTVNLAATDLGTNVLPKENVDEGLPMYNRFRVRVENSSGLFSLNDKVLTL